MREIKVRHALVTLNSKEEGKGEITVKHEVYGIFNHYWGAMGSSLEEFLCRINSEYFAQKLCVSDSVFDPKKTTSNVRKAIKEVVPWYQHFKAQKELRREVKLLENYRNVDSYVAQFLKIPDQLILIDYSWKEEEEFKELIKEVFDTDPWTFLEDKYSSEYLWLLKLHKTLKSKLS